MEFTVNPDNGDKFTVVAAARDVMQWEKLNEGRSALDFAQGTARLVDMYQIAWIAAKRLKLFTGSLEDFEATCDLEFPEVDDSNLPTQKAA